MPSVLESSDFVISVKVSAGNGKPTAEGQNDLSSLVRQLNGAGIFTQARPGENDTMLVFVKVDDNVLFRQVKSFILKKYLQGLKSEIDDDEQIVSNLTEADKLRAINSLLTHPTSEGGLGITPGSGAWESVETITPIYDYKSINRLFWKWMKKPLIDESDIERIREIAGEKTALYFAFVRFYFLWLGIPTTLGLVSSFFFDKFSIVFTILNSIWSITFINAWKKRELIYATTWNTRDCGKVEVKRAQFKGETEDIDFVTETKTPYFPDEKRTLKKIKFIPTAVFGGFLLLTYQLFCFVVEISVNEIYQGPGKVILGLVPTVLAVVGAPVVTAYYSTFVSKAVDEENHETESSYNSSITQKLWVHNFLGGYAPLFITVFLYLPFGHVVNSYLPLIQNLASRLNIPVVQDTFQIATGRLIGQFGFFTLISLIIGFVLENVVPLVLRLFRERSNKSSVSDKDSPEEADFLKNVRKQVNLPKFDVTGEYRELALNFGYLAIFGPISSIAPLFSFISVYIEIKGDLEKLLIESQRPVPTLAETIDPWNTNLKISTWIGTFIAPLITALFREQDKFLASSQYSPLVSAFGVPLSSAAAVALVYENFAIVFNVIVSALFKASRSKIEHEHDLSVLNLRRSYISAYSKESSVKKRDIAIDPSTFAWKGFSDGGVLKQTYFISSDGAESKPQSTASGISRFNGTPQNRASKTSNSSTVSKAIPQTATVGASIASLKSGVVGNITSSSVPSTITNEETARASTPSSQGSISLNGATLPPNFGSKKNSTISVEAGSAGEGTSTDSKKNSPVLVDKLPSEGATDAKKSSGVSGEDSFVPQPAEALEGISKDKSNNDITLDPSKRQNNGTNAEPAVEHDLPKEHRSDPEQHVDDSPQKTENQSSNSSLSIPHKKKGIFKTIKKKAINASHSLHLPNTPTK